jgi:hypothetical protein
MFSKVERELKELTLTYFTEFNRVEGMKNIDIPELRQAYKGGLLTCLTRVNDAINNCRICGQLKGVRGIHTSLPLHDFNLNAEIARRPLEALINFKRELALTLTPRIMEKLAENEWPLDDTEIRNMTNKLVLLSSYLTALETSIKFIPTFHTQISSNKLIWEIVGETLKKMNEEVYADNYIKLDEKRGKPLINRESLKDSANWCLILDDAKENLESIIFKV